jgi:hypothetical protein
MTTGKFHRRRDTPQQVSTGVYRQPVSPRCKATHDVPYTLRCIHDRGHVLPHQDRDGRVWPVP